MSIRNYDPLNEQDPELPVGESLARKAARCGDDSNKPALRWTAGPWRYNAERLRIESETAIAKWSEPDDPQPVCIVELRANMGGDNIKGDTMLMAAAPDLASALLELRKQLREHVKLDVKKHYSLMVADAAAGKALHKAGVS